MSKLEGQSETGKCVHVVIMFSREPQIESQITYTKSSVSTGWKLDGMFQYMGITGLKRPLPSTYLNWGNPRVNPTSIVLREVKYKITKNQARA